MAAASRSGAANKTPAFTRPALAPGLLAAVILMATVGLLTSDLYYIVRFIVCILTVIVAFYAIKARRGLWLIALVPIALFVNPIFPLPSWPFTIDPEGVFAITMLSPVLLVAAAVTLKVPDESGESRR